MPRKPKPSLQMIKQILEFAAALGKDNLAGIQRTLDNYLKTLAVEERPMEMAPDTRTIRRILNDFLNQMSQEAVLENLPPSVWHLRNDYENIKKLAERTSQIVQVIPDSQAILLDRATFKTSNRMLSERELRDFLLSLELHHSYDVTEYIKLIRFWGFFSLEGNKYTDPELRKPCDDLWQILDEVVCFLKLEFAETQVSEGFDHVMFEFSPSGLGYLRDASSQEALIEKCSQQLHRLINSLREAFKEYRIAVRGKLHL